MHVRVGVKLLAEHEKIITVVPVVMQRIGCGGEAWWLWWWRPVIITHQPRV